MGADVSINRVAHRFQGPPAPAVLEDITLQIEPGERIALVGESGCGKSTLLRMMAGLLIPDQGNISIGGQPVRQPDARWNLIFQKPALYPWLNVYDNVALGMRFTGQKRDLSRRTEQVLTRVGLADRGRSRIQDLSGGQQQRVALARSLALDPEMILLDEPFSALDTVTRRALQSQVLDIVAARDITLVLVTHDLEEALMVGERVILMQPRPGRLQQTLAIDLPYPRDYTDPRFIALRETLIDAFEQGMRRAAPVPHSSLHI